ncbi:MAG: GGDEF domain-containing protein [Bacilli bacterium]
MEEKILATIDNLYYVVKNSSGNVVSCTNGFKEMYEKIISSSVCYGGEYYYKEADKWYDIVKKEVVVDGKKYVLETLFDITKFKVREKDLQTDETTNLFNKKVTFELVNEYLSRISGTKEEFSIIIGDIDYFKRINDLYGHECGDVVLSRVASCLKESIRSKEGREPDVIGRIGGEEFLILLKNIDKNTSFKRTNDIRKRIENLDLAFSGMGKETICISFGIVHNNGSEYIKDEADDFRSLSVRRSDKALYLSKLHGRNLVTLYKDPEDYDK